MNESAKVMSLLRRLMRPALPATLDRLPVPARAPSALSHAFDRLLALPLPLLFAALMLLRAGLSLVRLEGFPFWADEAYTVLAVRAPTWGDLLLLNLRNEETPPLYFLLLRGWAMLWGSSQETTLRLFSTLCLMLTIPLVGWLGQRLWNRKIGLLAALLLTINPFTHYYSLEVRAYALGLLVITLVYVLALLFAQRPTPWVWALYILSGAAALYTNYLAAFGLAGTGCLVGVVLLRRWWHSRTRTDLGSVVAWVLAQVLIIGLLVPWIPAVAYQYLVSSAALAPAETSFSWKLVLTLIVFGASLPDGTLLSSLCLVVAGCTLLLALIQTMRYSSPLQASWLIAIGLAPLLCILLLFEGESQFSARYTLLCLPAYLLVLAAGLSYPLPGKLLRPVLLGSLIGLSLAYILAVKPSRQRQGGWDDMAVIVAAQAQPQDAIFFAPPWAQPAFDVQYTGPAIARYGAASFAQYYYEAGNPFLQPINESALAAHLSRGERAWIVWDRIYAPRPTFSPNVIVDEQRFGSTTLLLVTPQE